MAYLTSLSSPAQRAQLDRGDGIETHDCFTISQYMAIDHFGLTKPGCSGDAVDRGITARDGALPMNPSGGLIGVG
ncbi:MAG TPA: hypothetical protein VIJ07_06230, partial [Dermatophilaceae bacterium]